MMAFGLRVWNSAGNPVLAPDGVTLRPTTWSADAVGGPAAAQIEAVGSIDGLLALGTWLGFQIEITTDDGLPLWWGHVDGVALSTNGLEREITLREMANRVKVLYTQTLPGGGQVSAETLWTEDATSVGAYGKRELVHSASAALTATQASALQGRILSAGKAPQRRLQIGEAKRTFATVTCRGDWLRLGDVYYQQLDGLEQHNPGSGTAIPVGLGFTTTYLGVVGEAKEMHEIDGKFEHFGYENLLFTVAGSALNDGIKMVASASAVAPIVYNSTFTLQPADDLHDAANGLEFLATGDVFWLSGFSSGNSGARLVKTTGSYRIEVSPSWNGGYSAGGPAAGTIRRGNKISIEPAAWDEAPNGSTVETVTAYGQRVYQSFGLGINTAWTAATVEVRVRKIGAPLDALRLGLYLDNGGVPGAMLEQVSLAAGEIADRMGWVAFSLSNTAQLSFGTTYGLQIDRTGAMDAANYFEVEIDTAGTYTRGGMRLHDGATWQASVPGDVIFRVLGAQGTAQQVATVVAGAGVGLAPAQIESSGIVAMQYQAGDETALAIVDKLLAQGASSGERLLAQVLPDRRVRIFVRTTASSTPRLLVWRAGGVEQAQGESTPPGWLPVGVWLHVDDVLLSGAWAGLSPVFIERAEYSVGDAGLRLETEDQRAMAAVFGTQQG